MTALKNRNPRQNILTGSFAPGVNLTPSAEPFPLIGQRAVRGTLVLLLIALATTGICESIWLLYRVANRTIRVAPAAEFLSAGVNGGATTDLDIIAFAESTVVLAETWTYEDIAEVPGRIRSRFDSSQHRKIEDQYAEIQKKVTTLWQHRTIFPKMTVIGARTNGLFTVGVLYDQLEITGKDIATLKSTAGSDKVALINIIKTDRTLENPYGLLITDYQRGTKQEWLSAGMPNFWTAAPKPAAKKDQKKCSCAPPTPWASCLP